MNNFMLKHTKSLLFFIFFTIGLLILLVLVYDYNRYNDISKLDINDLNSISGNVIKVKRVKTKYEIFLDSTDIEFVINEDLNINKDDFVTIYYYKKDSFRNDETDIIELRKDLNVLYDFDTYIKDNNPKTYLYIIIGISCVDVILLFLALLMLKFPYMTTEEMIMKYAKKYNLNDKQIEEAKSKIIPYYNEAIVDKEKLINNFKNSFYINDNKYFTTAMEYIENSKCGDVLNEVLFDILNDNELRVIYDACLIDNSACFFVYKLNNKLVSIYMFNEDDKKFLIDETCLYFIYPKEMKMNIAERELFFKAIKAYMIYNNDLKVEVKK